METKSKPRTSQPKQSPAKVSPNDDMIVVDANDALLAEVEEEADARTHTKRQDSKSC
jgi:hypothetical protein